MGAKKDSASLLRKSGRRNIYRNHNCLFCCKEFPTYFALELHINVHTRERPYQCSDCSAAYVDYRHLDSHRNAAHLKIRYQCDECQKFYYNRGSLHRHKTHGYCARITKKAQKSSTSDTKGNTTKNTRSLKNPKISPHKQQKWIVENSDVKLARRRDPGRPSRSQNSSEKSCQGSISNSDTMKPYELKKVSGGGQCKDVRPPGPDILRCRKVNVKGKKFSECPVCKRLFSTRTNMVRHHRAVHLKLKPTEKQAQKCSKCQVTFDSYKLLWEHIKENHLQNVYDCPVCFKRFTNQCNMVRHRKSHEQATSNGNDSQQKAVAKSSSRIVKIPLEKDKSAASTEEGFSILSPQIIMDCWENKVRALYEENQKRNQASASFFLHLNRYDPSSC